jgi:hypothetical protein
MRPIYCAPTHSRMTNPKAPHQARVIRRDAAAATLSLGIGSAYASEGGQVANTFFTSLPGVIAQAPAQNAPGRRDGAERAGGAGLRHPVEPRHVAVPGIPWW